jgi:ppGpp synthetase/RelA/SpoT-type nucleotidyltranferase
MMLNKKEFLRKYRIPPARFQSAELKWDDLVQVHDHYVALRNQLEPIASLFVESLRRVPEVHSLKARTKDPEHLIEKVIRKRIAEKRRKIDVKNYYREITDLVGVRALHLFKDDWLAIHNAITSIFSLRGNPTANIRKGDSNPMIDAFKKKKWRLIEHQFGYRSIHYLAVSQPGKDRFTVEIQVRTIFEEGWSEIDHQTRYPYDFENILLPQYLVLFNRLAGSADEMGSFVKTLKDQWELRQIEHASVLAEKDELIARLKARVQSSQIQIAEKRSLVADLDSLSKRRPIISLHRPLETRDYDLVSRLYERRPWLIRTDVQAPFVGADFLSGAQPGGERAVSVTAAIDKPSVEEKRPRAESNSKRRRRKKAGRAKRA